MDGMMSDVLVVMNQDEDALPVIGAICGLDGVVHEHLDDGVLDCSVPAQHVHSLAAIPGVRYVRHVQSYLSVTTRVAAET
jgi:hypothetical protein